MVAGVSALSQSGSEQETVVCGQEFTQAGMVLALMAVQLSPGTRRAEEGGCYWNP